MGRNFAGVMGLLAFLSTIGQATVHGWNAEEGLLRAAISLFAFAALGYLAGRVGQETIENSVRNQVARELVALEATKQSKK